MATRFLETAIPMRGRMIHDERGRLDSQLYDSQGGQVMMQNPHLYRRLINYIFRRVAAFQCINSVERGILNEELLDQAAANALIQIYFQHKLTLADFDRKVATFAVTDPHRRGSQIDASFDLCIGADGSYSNVRRQMMRFVK